MTCDEGKNSEEGWARSYANLCLTYFLASSSQEDRTFLENLSVGRMIVLGVLANERWRMLGEISVILTAERALRHSIGRTAVIQFSLFLHLKAAPT